MNNTALPEPSIRIILPRATLRLEHVTYLRNLATGDSTIICALPCSQVSRLKLLGLVEEYEIPLLKKEVEDYKATCENIITKMKELVSVQDWKGLANLDMYGLRRSEPKPRTANRISKAGLKLLKESEVTVKLKKGCA